MLRKLGFLLRGRWRSTASSPAVTPQRVLLAVVVVTLAWVEWLALEVKALQWSNPDFSSSAIRVLIVADPQLIGYRDEPWLSGPIARWDADRYTRRSFARIVSHVRPQLILFLGDLFDEGVKDDDIVFNTTLARFRNIFPIAKDTQVIYIAGDNDVGGEWESVKSDRVARFNRLFKSKFDMRSLGLESLAVIHTNLFNGKSDYLTDESVPSTLRLVLSHAPIVRGYGRETRLMQTLSPNLIISAHDHNAEYYVRSRDSVNFDRHAVLPGDAPADLVVSRDGPIIELQAPTCSYRMGVFDMGFGVVYIEPQDDGHQLKVRFQVFWLPGRYPQLALYVGVLVCILVYVLRLYWLCRYCPFHVFRRWRLFANPGRRPAV